MPFARTILALTLLLCAGVFPSRHAHAQICTSTASCLAVHGSGGCNDAECCITVCSLDPACCSGNWDASCVFTADSYCVGICGASVNGSCFTAHLNPSCDDETCCLDVCASDAFCCDQQWDFTCALIAGFTCSGTPGVCPGQGNCNTAHATGGCNDAGCCEVVCSVDPTCCSGAWDTICVTLAADICQGNCQPACPFGSNLEPESCGSRNNDGCYSASGGNATILPPNRVLCGTLGFMSGSGTAADVDTFSVTLTDPDGDGLVSVRLQLTSASKAFVALLPITGCAPIASAALSVNSNLCILRESDALCVPVGTYRVLVAVGEFPYVSGIPQCGPASNYTLHVETNQKCVTACGSGDASCYFPRGVPGCTDTACCSSVCAVDPACCNAGWDGLCVDAAVFVCGLGPSAQDECEGALVAVEGLNALTLERAVTNGTLLPTCTLNGSTSCFHDVWFKYTATRSGTTTVETCGYGNFDSRMAVYSGSCANRALIACNDNGQLCLPLGTSRLTFTAACDETYLIQIGAAQGYGGDGQFNIFSAGASCAPCVADLNANGFVDAADLSILLNAWGTKGGVADIDQDGIVDAPDLTVLLSAFGNCP
ncbi:MAG: hypothetical protein EXS10_02030 [Phycisphaerales bacterium]|nr:hypothetical protein [Phycisphaerales bacterium]